jgi:hypothetical protein
MNSSVKIAMTCFNFIILPSYFISFAILFFIYLQNRHIIKYE